MPAKTHTSRRIKCAACLKDILATELGGVAISTDKKSELWFHDSIPCIIGVADIAVDDHAGELKRIGKDRQNGKRTINQKLAEPPFVPENQLG